MSTIHRAAWLAFPHDGMNPFSVNESGGRDFWWKNGVPVHAVVEVQPVLDALWSIRDMTNFDREASLIELIHQLEKAAQP